MKYLLRIIALPFWIGAKAVFLSYVLIITAIDFVKYGGEAITYGNKINSTTILDTYMLLKDEKL